ncbi:MAG: hypothetical protein OEM83_02800 [Gammaproteobacteria bacterium]|nr:hypothetical protein [Gammaproteobacteria bacterium]MDH5511574.1 hypothetical protein [Gammaproteobacteria bacterium]
METGRTKGQFTFRTAAVFFFISALFELLAAGTPVPLFGAIREGAGAMAYHLVYAVLFVALGLGLWAAKSWGLALIVAGVALYTLDRVQLLLSKPAMDAVITQLQEQLQASMPGIEKAMVAQAFVLLIVLFVLGWWGFALYAWWRREYFQGGKT